MKRVGPYIKRAVIPTLSTQFGCKYKLKLKKGGMKTREGHKKISKALNHPRSSVKSIITKWGKKTWYNPATTKIWQFFQTEYPGKKL